MNGKEFSFLWLTDDFSVDGGGCSSEEVARIWKFNESTNVTSDLCQMFHNLIIISLIIGWVLLQSLGVLIFIVLWLGENEEERLRKIEERKKGIEEEKWKHNFGSNWLPEWC